MVGFSFLRFGCGSLFTDCRERGLVGNCWKRYSSKVIPVPISCHLLRFTIRICQKSDLFKYFHILNHASPAFNTISNHNCSLMLPLVYLVLYLQDHGIIYEKFPQRNESMHPDGFMLSSV